MKRRLVLFIIGLLVLTGCGSQATFGDPIVEGEPTPIPTAIVPSKPIYTVQQGDIVYEREFRGRTAPTVSQDLFFSQDGRIATILIEDGADVLAGDVIATLDTSVLEEQLRQAQTDLAVAQSLLQNVVDQTEYNRQRASLNLELAQLRLDYAIMKAGEPRMLEDVYLIAESEIERDLAQLALDELNAVIDPELQVAVTHATQRVANIQEQIDTATLVAPLSGQLLALRLSAGDPVIAYESVGVIADLRELEVQDTLGGDDMSELTEGMPVTIKVRNRPGEVYDGTVVALPAPFGSGDDEITRIRFNNPADGATFGVGDFVTIVITIAESQNTLWLPQAALREYNGRDFVVVDNNGIQQRVDVELGLVGDEGIEILAGVTVDQRVIGP